MVEFKIKTTIDGIIEVSKTFSPDDQNSSTINDIFEYSKNDDNNKFAEAVLDLDIISENNINISRIKQVMTEINNHLKKKKLNFRSINDLSKYTSQTDKSEIILKIAKSSRLVYFQAVKILFDFIEQIIVILVSIFIVIHLNIRSKLSSSIFYPSEPSKFPYVYYDEDAGNKQNFLTSTIFSDSIKEGSFVFDETRSSYNKKGEHNNNKKTAFCMINDPNKISNHCKSSNDTNNKDPYKKLNDFYNKKIKFENMSFFSKQFIESNAYKTSLDTTFYGLLTYVMAYTNISINGNMSKIDNLFKGIFENLFDINISQDKVSFMSSIMPLLLVLLFYILFNSSSKTIKHSFESLFFNKKLRKQMSKDIILFLVSKLFGFISTFLCPFIFFFKFLLVLIYPLSLGSSIIGFKNFSSVTSSFLMKLFCYFGIVFYLILFLTFILILIKSISKKTSVESLYKNIINEFINLIRKSLYSLQSSFGFARGKESFGSKGKSKKKKAKKKAKKQAKKAQAASNNGGGGGGGGGGDDGDGGGGVGDYSASDYSGTPSGGSNFSCPNPFSFLNFSAIFSFIRFLVMLFFGPIIILLFFIPMLVSLYMTFSISKSISLDYLSYFGIIKEIFCKYGNFIFYPILSIVILSNLINLIKDTKIDVGIVSLWSIIYIFLLLVTLYKYVFERKKEPFPLCSYDKNNDGIMNVDNVVNKMIDIVK